VTAPTRLNMQRRSESNPRARRAAARIQRLHPHRARACSARCRGAPRPVHSRGNQCSCRAWGFRSISRQGVLLGRVTVMVPLFILCTYKPGAPRESAQTCTSASCLRRRRMDRASLPSGLPAHRARGRAGWRGRSFLLDRCFRVIDPPHSEGPCARAATRRARKSLVHRAPETAKDGLGARIFPRRMVNSLEADGVARLIRRDKPHTGGDRESRAIEKLLVIEGQPPRYCQPVRLACLGFGPGPPWPCRENGRRVRRGLPPTGALDWLKGKQLLE